MGIFAAIREMVEDYRFSKGVHDELGVAPHGVTEQPFINPSTGCAMPAGPAGFDTLGYEYGQTDTDVLFNDD